MPAICSKQKVSLSFRQTGPIDMEGHCRSLLNEYYYQMAPTFQHFKKMWMAWKWILACGDQPVLLLHSSRSSSHWMQTTLEEKLTLNAPRMESSKNWMRCLVSALRSFLHRERKQEFKPPLPTRNTVKQVNFCFLSFLFLFFIPYWIWDFMLFTPPWAGIALAVLSAGRRPGEAARAVCAGIPHCHLCRGTAGTAVTHGTLCQPALSEDGSLAG